MEMTHHTRTGSSSSSTSLKVHLLRNLTCPFTYETLLLSDIESRVVENVSSDYSKCYCCLVCTWTNSEHDFAFQYEYVNGVEDHLLCPITQEPLVDPVQFPCGHTFSKKPIHVHITENKREFCPLCRAIYKAADVTQVTTLALLQPLNALLVRCPHQEQCKWTGPRANVTDHLKQCPAEEVECEFAAVGQVTLCKFRARRDVMAAHVRFCPYKPIASTVEKLVSEGTKLKGRVRELETNNTSMQTEMLQLLRAKTHLSSQNRGLNNRVKNLEERVKDLERANSRLTEEASRKRRRLSSPDVISLLSDPTAPAASNSKPTLRRSRTSLGLRGSA